MRIKCDNLFKEYGTVPRWNKKHINVVSSHSPYGPNESTLNTRLIYQAPPSPLGDWKKSVLMLRHILLVCLGIIIW